MKNAVTNEFRWLAPETIWLESEDYEPAAQISDRLVCSTNDATTSCTILKMSRN